MHALFLYACCVEREATKCGWELSRIPFTKALSFSLLLFCHLTQLLLSFIEKLSFFFPLPIFLSFSLSLSRSLTLPFSLPLSPNQSSSLSLSQSIHLSLAKSFSHLFPVESAIPLLMQFLRKGEKSASSFQHLSQQV